ncbi:hypothetical protein M2103_000543 [Ereboglobus sp. PH5-5]|nr:hypothetical protein [Ereboglobus sp. PH5-5]
MTARRVYGSVAFIIALCIAPLNAAPSSAATWLDGDAPPINVGATWGVPWSKGSTPKDTTFALRDTSGKSIPVQSWTTAWWPDGSIKWTAHAIPAGITIGSNLTLSSGAPAVAEKSIVVREAAETVEVDTGVIRCFIGKSGGVILKSVMRNGKTVLSNGRLVALSSQTPDLDGTGGTQRTDAFQNRITSVTVEQDGPVRAVIKIKGFHSGNNRDWLPFTVRLYFYAGGETLRVMHSFVFDGDAEKDFLRGLGMRFDVPMTDLLHDRHVRYVGEGRGLWAEAVCGLTGLRRDPDANNKTDAIKNAQLNGLACPDVATFNPQVAERLQYIPAWGDSTLMQTSANGFMIRKRTKAGHGWIDADQGRRASGVGYIGGAKGGGVVFGLRDFWQRHPAQLDIRNAHTDAAEVTIWMYSPEAPAMDMRFYHDGLGQDTHEKQYKGGLEITYEDYEPGYGDAHGVARTSEIYLWALAATPSREAIVDMAALVREPARMVCPPERILDAKVFGNLLSLPDRSTPAKAAIEERLDWDFDFYKNQIEQRHWYGFWNYGDVMHTYDRERHVWKYDIGGFAWDNSELSTDLWLWYYYLRSARADAFRMAEAMTRHTGEVDVYHCGRFAGLGTRHNVQHWGCSAKQVRISTAANRRIYYYLTADERVGDLMRELLDVDTKLSSVDPARKLGQSSPLKNHDARISFGIDWASLAAAWLTEWERGGDAKYRDKLLRGMRDWGEMPLGFFTSDLYGYKVTDGSIEPLTLRGRAGDNADNIQVSSLDSVFGAMEIFAELIQLTENQSEYAGFKKAWLQYCTLYSAPKEERIAELGANIRGSVLQQANSRLAAYAAKMTGDSKLAGRAWKVFARPDYPGYFADWAKVILATKRFEGPDVLNPIDEAQWISTNFSAQWGLSAIQCLSLVGDEL